MKARTHSDYKDQFLKTKQQWEAKGLTPKESATGIRLWTNGYHQRQAIYYRPEDLRDMTKEELRIFKEIRLAPRREAQCKRREKQRRTRNARVHLQEALRIPPIPVEIPSRGIVLDLETTGLDPSRDEILQVAIIDLDGKVLLNSYVQPLVATAWPAAQEVNHIDPSMVAEAPHITELLPEIQGILNGVDLIVGYNVGFDLSFLAAIELDWNAGHYDVMAAFAPIYGEWSDYFGDWKWKKLTVCARYYDYDWSGGPSGAHNALSDCYATLHCYKAMQHTG